MQENEETCPNWAKLTQVPIEVIFSITEEQTDRQKKHLVNRHS